MRGYGVAGSGLAAKGLLAMKRWTLLVLPALCACTESVESTDVRTSGVYPEFQVVADGSSHLISTVIVSNSTLKPLSL